jgi:hypothetical protein
MDSSYSLTDGGRVILRVINSVNLNHPPSPMQSLRVTVKVHHAMHNIFLSKFSVASLALTLWILHNPTTTVSLIAEAQTFRI